MQGSSGSAIVPLALTSVLAFFSPAPAAPAAFAPGDVFGGLGNSTVRWIKPDNTPVMTLGSASICCATGMAFDASGRLYVTTFNGHSVMRFDTDGSQLADFIPGPIGITESIVFDLAGNAYVGQLSTPGIRKFDASGAQLATYTTTPSRVDWLDLAADQRTMFFTNESPNVYRYDVSTGTQLTPFSTALQAGYALRIRSGGTVLVANGGDCVLLDTNGAIVKHYATPGELTFHGLDLDPDGTSFWAAGLSTGISRFDIASGSLIGGPYDSGRYSVAVCPRPPRCASGDLFVGLGNATVKWLRSDGTPLKTLTGTASGCCATGMAFDASGRLYVTTFNQHSVMRFGTDGSPLADFIPALAGSAESIVFDRAGNAYVGRLNSPGILKFDANGAQLATYTTTPSRVDWLDLAQDQRTVLFTNEGPNVNRYDVSAEASLTPFSTALLEGHALRIRPDGTVLVANFCNCVLLDTNGAIMRTYTAPGCPGFHGLDLDSDGTSFWTAAIQGGVYRYDIASGSVLAGPYAFPNTNAYSIAVCGQAPVVDVPNMRSPSRESMAIYNNPLVSGVARVCFGVPSTGPVDVRVFDVSGRLIRTLADRTFESGEHTVTWDGTDAQGDRVKSGVYFTQVRFLNTGFRGARQLVILR